MSLSKKLRFEVFKRDGFACTYCGAKPPGVNLEVDHVVPVSRGGSNDFRNLTTACLPCNRGKTNVPLLEEFAWLLIDGPQDGGLLLSRSTNAPFLWILKDGEGGTHRCYDEIAQDEDGDYCKGIKGGHPGFCMPIHRPFDFGGIYKNTGSLEVIGAYIAEHWRDDFYHQHFPLTWWTPDRIIVELSA